MENLVELKIGSNEGEDLDEGPSGERWPPLGAAAVEDEQICCRDYDAGLVSESERLRDLEEQQELLNSSLIALTTHFAQVQFRLRQIIDAPAQDREVLLQDLEEFAFKGIPDMPAAGCQMILHQDSKEFEAAIAAQRMKQKELIGQLKVQLEELENYAYEMGEAGLPQNVIMEKQKVIIDELKDKLNLNVDDIDHLTLEDIRHQVDSAIGQLVSPLKMKEQLVTQLKTQIVDLERFIEFLQGDSENWTASEAAKFLGMRTCKCSCPVHSKDEEKFSSKHNVWKSNTEPSRKTEEVREKTLNIIRRVAALLQIFAVSQFGCGSSLVRLNSLKKSMKVHHWGDLRARLELAVVNILALAADQEAQDSYDYSTDSETYISESNAKMTTAVRKQLAITIRDLMEHGLVSADVSNSLVPFMGCFATRSKELPSMHAWELILRYYDIKNGARFNSTPVRKLSQSFNLNIVGSRAISNKQSMLSAIGNIVSLHTQFKRSYDAQFKAFICAGLNAKKLVVWLRLIFRCQPLIETYYKPWGYVAKTGFEDSLQSLDKLTHLKFDLPVDIAVHQFQNIKDAF
ncbi:hypothetical protein RUM44_006545 [Polyplax serrata]|uniref:RUN domain-containing protein n=1 Tax=Polyplax serrata TaxID=468196 RepID=A0ABR1AIF2_POLSC